MARCSHGFETTVIRCELCKTPKPVSTANRSGKVEDITGQTFAGATVIERAENDKSGSVTWHCRLECGHTKRLAGVHLRQQHKLGGKIRCAEGCSVHKRTSENQNRNEGTNG
jgi:hypothetical protein